MNSVSTAVIETGNRRQEPRNPFFECSRESASHRLRSPGGSGSDFSEEAFSRSTVRAPSSAVAALRQGGQTDR
jgi:hypothetical protein